MFIVHINILDKRNLVKGYMCVSYIMSKNALYGKNWTPVFAPIRPGFMNRAFFERHETVTHFSPTPPQKNEHKETDSIYAIGSSLLSGALCN